MAQLAVEMTGDEAKLWRSFQKIIKEQQKMEGGFKRIGKAGKQAGRQAKQGFGPSALGSLRNYATGLVGVGGLLAAYRLITAELRQQADLQSQMRTEQVTLASARKDLLRNMPGATKGEKQRALAGAGAIARRTNVDEKAITRALADAMSGSGGELTASLAAVEQAAKFLADKPAAIPKFAGSLLDLAAVTGTTDARVNLGYMQLVAGMSRVVDPRQQARNIPTSLIGLTGAGATAQGAAAFYSALTVAGADVEGALSGTAGISFALQLRDFLPEEETMGARIAKLQADRGAALSFLGGLSVEKKAIVPIETLLLDPESVMARQYQANLGKMLGPEGLIKLAEQTLSDFLLDPTEAVAVMERSYKDAVLDITTGDPKKAMADVHRKGLIDVLKASGMGAMAEMITKGGFELRTAAGQIGASETAIRILESRADQLRHPQAPFFGRMVLPPAGFGPPARPATPEELRQAGVIERLLEEINEHMKRQTKLLEDQKQRDDENRVNAEPAE